MRGERGSQRTFFGVPVHFISLDDLVANKHGIRTEQRLEGPETESETRRIIKSDLARWTGRCCILQWRERVQMTIPEKVRKASRVNPGDKLQYEVEVDRATIRVPPGTSVRSRVHFTSKKGEGMSFARNPRTCL